MRKLKRSMAMLLSFLMVLSLMAYPISVRAEEGNSVSAATEEVGDGETLLITEDGETEEETDKEEAFGESEEEDIKEEASDEKTDESKETITEEESTEADAEEETLMEDEISDIPEERNGAGEEDGYQLWVGGVQVTSENRSDILKDGCVSYDPVERILTLKDAVINGKAGDTASKGAGICSKVNEGITIQWSGRNEVNGASYSSDTYGIYAYELTLAGSGVLNINAASPDGFNCGVECTGLFTMESGIVNIAAGNKDSDYSCRGISSRKKVDITGGNLTITAGGTDCKSSAYGINTYGDIYISGKDTLVSIQACTGVDSEIATGISLEFHEHMGYNTFNIASNVGMVTIAGQTQAISKWSQNDNDDDIRYEFNTAVKKASTNVDGTDAQDYVSADHNSYKYICFQQDEVKKYSLWVGGIQVTSANQDNITGKLEEDKEYSCASFDPLTNTLTLKNISIDGNSSTEGITGEGICSKLKEGLNIYIIGYNDVDGSEKFGSRGILVQQGNLTFDGTGTLEVDAHESAHDIWDSCGIYCYESIIIENGMIKSYGDDSETEGASYGICAKKDIHMKNGMLCAYGYSGGAESCGIKAVGNVILDEGYLYVRGSDASKGVGIDAKTITMNGGTLTATGRNQALAVAPELKNEKLKYKVSEEYEAENDQYKDYESGDITSYRSVKVSEDSYNLWVGGVLVTPTNCSKIEGKNISGKVSFNPTSKTLTLEGATVLGDGKNLQTYGAGIWADDLFDGELTIETIGNNVVNGVDICGIAYPNGKLALAGSGSLTVKSASPLENGYSYGIVCNSLTVKSGTIVAQSGKAYEKSYGICVYSDFTMENGTITAAGGEANESYGIYVYGGFTMKNGAITATGGKANKSYGIYVYSDFTMENGTITAAGGEANESYDIYVYGDFTMENGIISATGAETDSVNLL